ncbi:MAG TPA: lipocalin-like domain-containing protein [Methylocystis sp.]|nr:lipocalin-like domain-containing protein [Methylocystis sp.]
MTLDRRRALAALLLLASPKVRAEGYAGLADAAEGFEPVLPGRRLVFPQDHGAHPGFRIEWWYLTANLTGDDGARYGAQWTLFRIALQPGAENEGWADRNVYMGHAAATSASDHVFASTLARGGVGQAGVSAAPFDAFIDDWRFVCESDEHWRIEAKANGFAYRLDLRAEGPLLLHGDKGFSRKSDQGQASYYYSQPFFRVVEGLLTLRGREAKVTGRAWMDHEWASQPMSADQKGWDWFALHLASSAKVMLFRYRGATNHYAGTWIEPDGATRALSAEAIALTPLEETSIGDRKLPTRWRVAVKSLGLDIETTPLNARAMNGSRNPYWEGPIAFRGSHDGEGYLEMTGY